MKTVLLYSGLLVVGLALSQFLPAITGQYHDGVAHVIKLLTMFGLAFIMIHVGYEFDINKSRLREYGWDYVVAATAAAFPWLFCALYFVFVMSASDQWGSWDNWKESLLASRFAAPTSAGVLFSMLAAAGLAGTWVFGKARILAIFDDLDTVLLMIPLKMMIVGLKWQLGLIILIMGVLLWMAWRYLHAWRISITWPWVLGYSAGITLACEAIYFSSKLVDEVVSIHIEVLLPAFVLGCMIAKKNDGECVLELPQEKKASTVISAFFMVFVGLSMPAIFGGLAPVADAAAGVAGGNVNWTMIAVHVLAITIISNIGKMFPALCYRQVASWQERLAVAVTLFPRGEVGAGVLVISLSYGIGGQMITVAMFSLALNLLLTGVFIVIVQRLLAATPRATTAAPM